MLKKINTLFSNLFRKKEKKINIDKRIPTTISKFNDISGKSVTLEIRTNGKEKTLIISKEKNQLEIFLDIECAYLLSVLLQEYCVAGNFPQFELPEEE